MAPSQAAKLKKISDEKKALEAEKAALQAQLALATAQSGQKRGENALLLEAKIQEKQKKRKKKGRRTSKKEEGNEWFDLIDDSIKECVWRKKKIVFGPKMAKNAAMTCLKHISPKGFTGDSDEAKKNRETFAATYSDYVTKALNAKRNNVQGQLKNVCHKYWQKNGNTLPTVACMERKQL